MIVGVGAAASWVGDLVGKLINVKARKRGVNQKGNGEPSPDGLKLLNSSEMIRAWSGWCAGYAGCWCGSSPELGVTVLWRLNHAFLCSSPNYPALIFPCL